MITQPICAALAALAFVALFGSAPVCAQTDASLAPAHAIAMHGDPALRPDFPNLPYANPDAPKGGRLTLAYAGAFDSLNPYNVRALSTAQGLSGNVYQTLMMRSADEPFTLYGLIAQSIETDAARDHVVFHLDPQRAFLRRRGDHISRRRLHLQAVEGKGPAATARRPRPRQKRRDPRRPDGALRPDRRQ